MYSGSPIGVAMIKLTSKEHPEIIAQVVEFIVRVPSSFAKFRLWMS